MLICFWNCWCRAGNYVSLTCCVLKHRLQSHRSRRLLCSEERHVWNAEDVAHWRSWRHIRTDLLRRYVTLQACHSKRQRDRINMAIIIMAGDVHERLSFNRQFINVTAVYQIYTRCSAIAKGPRCKVRLFWPKVEDWNCETIFYGHYRSVFNHCDVTGQQSNRIRWKNAK